jgi:hypothetical protein
MLTKALEASSIALKTYGWGIDPPKRVRLVAALMTRFNPYFSYGSYAPTKCFTVKCRLVFGVQ